MRKPQDALVALAVRLKHLCLEDAFFQAKICLHVLPVQTQPNSETGDADYVAMRTQVGPEIAFEEQSDSQYEVPVVYGQRAEPTLKDSRFDEIFHGESRGAVVLLGHFLAGGTVDAELPRRLERLADHRLGRLDRDCQVEDLVLQFLRKRLDALTELDALVNTRLD